MFSTFFACLSLTVLCSRWIIHYLSKNQGTGDEKFLLDHIVYLPLKSELLLVAPVFEMLHKGLFYPFQFQPDSQHLCSTCHFRNTMDFLATSASFSSIMLHCLWNMNSWESLYFASCGEDITVYHSKVSPMFPESSCAWCKSLQRRDLMKLNSFAWPTRWISPMTSVTECLSRRTLTETYSWDQRSPRMARSRIT